MAIFLKTGRTLHEDCLFYRTEKLFRQEIEQGKNPKILQNGIEVVPGRSAPLYFRTFLGSVGNLILEWSIREACTEDDFFIISDATGLESSDWIRFEQLDLPKSIVMEEITDFIYEDSVADTFARYLSSSSNIIVH